MKWNNFLECLPNIGMKILIVNLYRNQERTVLLERFFTCESEKYMNIIGEHNMDMRYTFWTKINTFGILNEIQS